MEENKSITSFLVAGEYFAFETETIRHILENMAPTRVPLTKPFVKGIINNHGNMIPVVDFRTLIGKEPDDTLPEQCIVVVGFEAHGKEDLVGFKVDEMDDVFEFDADNFKSEVVIEVEQGVQNAIAGTVKADNKFVYLIKTDELTKALI